MSRYRDNRSPAEQAALLAECRALDAAYADAERWHAARASTAEDVDPQCSDDAMAELRKAALSNGRP